jgi:F0F1-type ATP synthase assembly protein I
MTKILLIQFILTLLIAAGYSIKNGVIGYSILLGGLIYSIPVGFALQREFSASQKSATDAKQVLIWMYGNELLKLGLTVALFIVTFGLLQFIHSPSLLITYISSHLLAILLTSVFR